VIASSDEDLVRRARAGDQAAFNLLIERYQGMAEHMAGRMLPASDATGDILQETWLQAYLSIRNLRDPGRFRSWLVGILLNLCKSFLRERQRRRAGWPLGGVDDDSIPDPEAGNPLDVAIERELHQRVLAAVEELPRAQRDAVLLFYYDSLSVAEIAAISGVSVNLVKVRLHRARLQLREYPLSDYFSEGQPASREPVEMTASPNLPITNLRITEERKGQMVEVSVADIVRMDEKNMVVLLEKGGNRLLPIWVGPFEASAIATGLRAFPTPRPMTFNFIASLLEALDASLIEARVESLKDEVFYGIARLKSSQGEKEVDARPSDVIALAVRTGSPLYVAEEIMRSSAKPAAEFKPSLGEAALPLGENFEAYLEEVRKGMEKPRKED